MLSINNRLGFHSRFAFLAYKLQTLNTYPKPLCPVASRRPSGVGVLFYTVFEPENSFCFILFPENIVYSVKELQDEVPELYLSHKERYESSIRKACILQRLQNEYGKKHKVLK